MSKQETVEVTIKLKVPKRLMQLLEEQNYFDWDKEDFWVSALKSIVGAELSALHFDEMERLYEKYGRDVDLICPPHDW